MLGDFARMKPARFVLALLAASLTAGCAARLSRTEAIDIATRAAVREGYRPAECKKPTARYEIGRDGRFWSVFFDGTVPMPGNHFSVEIDDRTGDAKVYGGL